MPNFITAWRECSESQTTLGGYLGCGFEEIQRLQAVADHSSLLRPVQHVHIYERPGAGEISSFEAASSAKKNCISHTISLYILFLIYYSKEIKTITKHNGNTNTLHSYLDNESLLSHLSIWSCVSIVNPSPDSSLLGKSGNLSCSRNSLISFRCDSSRDWRLVISSSRSRIPASNWLT